MVQPQLPHFERHHREARRSRRRFQLVMAGLFAVLFVAVGLQYSSIHADSRYTLAGRVYNSSTGAGLPNVILNICNHGTAVTSSTGQFSFGGLTADSAYCVRYRAGAPAGVTGPSAINNNPDVGAQSTYENQSAGRDCYQNITCPSKYRLWDRGADSGFDFKFTSPMSARGAKTSAPATKPAARTVDPLVAGTSGVASAGSATPTAPGNFQATVAGSNAVVSLGWDASSDDAGVKSYKLERSIDQTTWVGVGDTITGTNYDDKAVGFGIHYYYRLSAIDQAGKVSAYATADATTADYSTNTTGENTSTYTSDDGLVTVEAPAGAVGADADCSVSQINLPKDGKQPGSQQQPLVAGPYVVLCKTPAGDAVTQFVKPMAWTVNLNGKLKGLVAPKAYTYDSDGNRTAISGAKYDENSGMLSFGSVTPTQVIVLADVKQGIPVEVVLMFAIILGIVFGLAVLILRKKQKHTYDEYLRSKYYNL